MNINFKLNYQDLSIIRKQLFFYKLLTKYIDKACHIEADYFSVNAKLINKIDPDSSCKSLMILVQTNCGSINGNEYIIKFGELTNACWRVDQNLESWFFGDLEFGELVIWRVGFWRVDYNPKISMR